MAKFDESELIRSSESPVQADLKFLCGATSRLVQTTEEQSKKCVSMKAMLMEINTTLLQISNQLGLRPIEAESSHLTPPVTFSDSYVRDDQNRLPLVNRKSLLRKFEMPKFDGYNASDWLSKVERFFSVRRYSDLDKLDLVAFSLEGDVLKWFNWEMIRREFNSWEEFRRRLLLKFGAAPEESPRNRLFALKQKGTISAYVTEFEELSAQVIGLDDLHLEQIFYTGLKPEMREVLKLKEPLGLANQKMAVLGMEPSIPGENQKTFTSTPVTSYAQSRPLLLQKGEKQNNGQEESLGSGLFAIKQTGTVSADVPELEELSAQVIEQQTVYKEESVTQLQVHVSKLEHSLQIHNESPNVCENYHDVVGCDELGTAENLLSGLSQTSQVWEPGGVLKLKEPVGLVNQKKSRCLKASMFNFKRKKKRIKRQYNQLKYNYVSVREDWFNTLRRKESWRKHKHENLQIVSGLLGFNVVSFRCHKEYGLARMINWSQVRAEYSLMQGKLFVRNDFTSDGIRGGDIAKLLNSTGDKLQSYGYVLEVTFLQRLIVHQQQQKRTSIKSWRFKYKSRLKKIKVTDTKFLCEKVHRFDDTLVDAFHSGLRKNVHALLAAEMHESAPGQQQSSSIWHRWRRKPLFFLHFWKNSWILSEDLV